MNQILLVEDDPDILNHLTSFLKTEQFSVDTASGQKEALMQIDCKNYDLVLLDVSLKDGNGFGVCTAIKSCSQVPVIFLTASDDEFSVVTGLDLGADDYITKPFRPRELVSRIRSVLRRCGGSSPMLTCQELCIDTGRGLVTKGSQEVILSALEYRLLLMFVSNPKAILTRDRLLGELWDAAGEFVTNNTLTVYIKRLREKMDEPSRKPKFVKTVWGVGYTIEG